MMGILNKMDKCSSVGKASENKASKFDPSDITDLKIDTSKLLAEIEIIIENTGDQVQEIKNSSFAGKDIFKDQNFNERLEAIKQAIAIIEKSLSEY